ncbi:uncharacterized protein N7529_003090 [Penicillium soppii]|uniref:uncharacterized protein n=1 Tax=Penicillium soppii TaxID=69789 RepID=UPI002549673B|nr:uncharacterized protein N7529_003090 [Penicillium soppii]KAJ5874660.1 hypothetical protein N7529_003090 [Penicillium soppii]
MPILWAMYFLNCKSQRANLVWSRDGGPQKTRQITHDRIQRDMVDGQGKAGAPTAGESLV